MTDWSNSPDVERTPGKVSGAWCIKGTRCTVDAILNNADSTPEQIADMFEVPVDVVKRILAFASPTPAAPETIYIEPICDRCKDVEASGFGWQEEKDAAPCLYDDCPNKPVTYIRADLYDAQLKRLEQNAIAHIDETGGLIADLTYLLRKARDQLDAFGHAELIDEINEALS